MAEDGFEYMPLDAGIVALRLQGKRVAGVKAVVLQVGCSECLAPIGFMCQQLLLDQAPVCHARALRWWNWQVELKNEVIPDGPWISKKHKGHSKRGR